LGFGRYFGLIWGGMRASSVRGASRALGGLGGGIKQGLACAGGGTGFEGPSPKPIPERTAGGGGRWGLGGRGWGVAP
jgi:hypothetical protein